MATTHLVVPDSHAHPEFNNRRYTYLGHLINDIKPDVVVDIGDWFDMPSLSSYDRGKKSFEGRRYHRDIASGVEAQDRMFRVIRRQKKKLPRFVRTLGNHEDRISRAVEADPILEGTIGLDDLQSKEFGFEEVPFLVPVVIDGITYQHYFTTGVANRPVSGEHPGHALLVKQFTSCTQGHTHTFDHCVRSAIDGRKLHGLVVGCYQDYRAIWAGPANEVWNRGVVIKRNVEEGQYDIQWISLDAIEREYRNERP